MKYGPYLRCISGRDCYRMVFGKFPTREAAKASIEARSDTMARLEAFAGALVVVRNPH